MNHSKIKTLLVTVSIILAVPLATVNAAGRGGNPWNEVWDAINELREQVASIETSPGEPGPQGERGPQGEVGPQGEPGDSLTRFDVYSTHHAEPLSIEEGNARPSVSAYCINPDDRVTGGGYAKTGNLFVTVIGSRPVHKFVDGGRQEGWEVTFQTRGGFDAEFIGDVWVNCINFSN